MSTVLYKGNSLHIAGIDLTNVLLIVLSCVVAHIVPLKLLAYSYAVLGPAHYLSQMAWLHDKRYFVGRTWFAPVALGIAAILTQIFFLPKANASLPACLMVLAVATALMSFNGRYSMVIAIGIAVALLFAVLTKYDFALLVAVLLPTVVHVFMFTAAFMLNGAKRARQRSGYVSVAALGIAAISFTVIPTFIVPDTSSAIATFFQPVVTEMKHLGWHNSSSASIFGFLAFAYTYHYLNWFSKVEIIRWHKVPRTWQVSIAVVYVLLLVLYSLNFTWGLRVSFFLSIAHVVLELPLDMQVICSLIRLPRPMRRA
jgi:hypothetical protein